MNRKRQWWMRHFFIGLILAALPIGMPAQTREPAKQTPREHQLDLDSFEYVWKTVFEKHFDPDWGGVDWQAAHAEFRPQMEAAQSRREARAVLRTMLSRLKLTHFNIIPSELYSNMRRPESAPEKPGATGIHLRVIDDHALVISVDPASPADLAGIKTGWEILGISGRELALPLAVLGKEFEGKTLKDLVLADAVAGLLEGNCGDRLEVSFLDGADRMVSRTLILAESRGTGFQIGNLPPVRLWFEQRAVGQGIGYFGFDIFIAPAILMTAFNGFMKAFMDAPGIILDLRSNGGGQGEIACGMAGWLVAEKGKDLGTIRTRADTVKLIVRPRPGTFPGKVAVLVDGLSLCGAEIFAGGLRDLGRARIFGTHTGGAALGGNIERLPNGDGFMYAFADYVTAGGRVLEGQGLDPDVRVQHTREALLQGRDLILEAAADWIRNVK